MHLFKQSPKGVTEEQINMFAFPTLGDRIHITS